MRLLTIPFLLSLLPVPAGDTYAFNLIFLKDSTPYVDLTEEDKEMFNQAMVRALNTAKDKTTVSWENPKTGARGKITPANTFTTNGKTCRLLEIENSVSNKSARWRFNFCRQADNSWKFVRLKK